jgi:hypothetical protein
MATKPDIDPDGDVLLVFTAPGAATPSPAKKRRLSVKSREKNNTPAGGIEMLVSSKHLTSASPVFKAMLRNGSFQEGRTLAAAGKVTIPLPEDDSTAMKILLDILHHRSRQVPKTVTLKELAHLMILGDKY